MFSFGNKLDVSQNIKMKNHCMVLIWNNGITKTVSVENKICSASLTMYFAQEFGSSCFSSFNIAEVLEFLLSITWLPYSNLVFLFIF